MYFRRLLSNFCNSCLIFSLFITVIISSGISNNRTETCRRLKTHHEITGSVYAHCSHSERFDSSHNYLHTLQQVFPQTLHSSNSMTGDLLRLEDANRFSEIQSAQTAALLPTFRPLIYPSDVEFNIPLPNLNPSHFAFNPPNSFLSQPNNLDSAISLSINAYSANKTADNVCFQQHLTNSPPEIPFLQQLNNNIILILNHPFTGILPDISILWKNIYFFADILTSDCLSKYFLALRNLVEIEKQIINTYPEKKEEFEQAFNANIEVIDLLGSNTNILLHIPMLITLKYFIKKQLELNTSDIKNHISIFFGLKLVESVIIKTHNAIDSILSSQEAKRINFDEPIISIIKTNSDIIFKIISQIFTLVFGFNETLNNIFVSIIHLQINKSTAVFKNKKILFDKYDLSFLPDIFFLLEESEIKKIYEINRVQSDFVSRNFATGNYRPIDLVNHNCFELTDEIIVKMIGYYFIIFDDPIINFFKGLHHEPLVNHLCEHLKKRLDFETSLNHQYECLKQRFNKIKQKPIPFEIQVKIDLKILFYDTYYFFHFSIAFCYNRDILLKDYFSEISHKYLKNPNKN